MTEPEFFSISDLARDFDVTLRTIRFYEEQGLIEPQRDGRQRVFNRRDRARLKLILRGKRIGLSLSDIREILGLYEQAHDEASQSQNCWIWCWNAAACWKNSAATSTPYWKKSPAWKTTAARCWRSRRPRAAPENLFTICCASWSLTR